jgi:hypothetical protein
LNSSSMVASLSHAKLQQPLAYPVEKLRLPTSTNGVG